MKLRIELILPKSPVVLPTGFGVYQQALIYQHLSSEGGEWLHSKGFSFEKRRFKFFTFSSILEPGQYDRKTQQFTFPSAVSFYVVSPVDWILQQLATNLMRHGVVQLGRQKLEVTYVAVSKSVPVTSNTIIIQALTPIEMHSTFTTKDGRKKTHYYTPYESDFSLLINRNLQKKWMALFKKEECPFSVKIIPLFSGNKNEKIMYFGTGPQKTLVKGWKGKYRLEGEPDFLQFALEAGLGGKNAQGFGMVDIYSKK